MQIVTRNLLRAARGARLMVRHLLLPGHLECCYRPIVDWMCRWLPMVPLRVMTGYLPRWQAAGHQDLAAPLGARWGPGRWPWPGQQGTERDCMKETSIAAEDDSAIGEITILPDGRVCLFGASQQILEMLEAIPWSGPELQSRMDCLRAVGHRASCAIAGRLLQGGRDSEPCERSITHERPTRKTETTPGPSRTPAGASGAETAPAAACTLRGISARRRNWRSSSARYPVIYVVSWEEERVERCLREIAEKRDKILFVWTVTQGIVKSGVEPQQTKMGGGNTADPLAALDAVIQQVQPAIYLVQGFSPLYGGRSLQLDGHPPAPRRGLSPPRHLQVAGDRGTLAANFAGVGQGRDGGRVRPAEDRGFRPASRSDHRRREGHAAGADRSGRRRPRTTAARRHRADAQGGGKRLRQDAGPQRQTRCRRRERDLQRETADHQEERPAGVLRDERGFQPGGRAGQPQAVASKRRDRFYRPCRPFRAFARRAA